MKGITIETKDDMENAFEAFGTAIYRYIFFRVGYNKEVAEDLSQDVFVKAWTHRESFDYRKSSLKNWLYTIARNTVTDYYRMDRSKRMLSEETLEEISASSSSENSEQAFLMELILKTLDRMTEDERELIVLRYVEDRSVREVSQIIGKGYSATKVALHRAMKKLKTFANEQLSK